MFKPAFALSITGPAPTLGWPATAGRRYEVMSTTNLADIFLLRDALIPSNSAAQWSETNASSPQRLYRVRAPQSIDAMAVVYMVTTLIWLLIALRFVNPTQIVARAKQQQTTA